MGKQLIIKGADFSLHTVPNEMTLIPLGAKSWSALTLKTAPGFYIPADYKNVQGRKVTSVTFLAKVAGVITITVAESFETSKNPTPIQVITIESSQVGSVITVDMDVTIKENQIIGFGSDTDTGAIGYGNALTEGLTGPGILFPPSSVAGGNGKAPAFLGLVFKGLRKAEE